MRHRVLLMLAALVAGGLIASAGVATATGGSAPSAGVMSASPSASPPTGQSVAPARESAAASTAATPSQAVNRTAADCSKVGPDGFGHSLISGNVVWTGAVTFVAPCVVSLANGTALHVANATLQSDKLFITDDQPTGLRSSVEVLNSTLTGSSAAGFQIRLAHSGSTATIVNSRFSYMLSIGASVGAVADTAATLNVLNSRFTSNGPGSEGVVLVSTGRGVFTNDQFAVNSDQGAALIFAGSCVQANNVGAATQCSES